jgi:hypothetical protein
MPGFVPAGASLGPIVIEAEAQTARPLRALAVIPAGV